MAKTIEIDNYRFREDEISLLQGGIWERHLAPVREANNQVRRQLGQLLHVEALSHKYHITVHDQPDRLVEEMVVGVQGTHDLVVKAQLRQNMAECRVLTDPQNPKQLLAPLARWASEHLREEFKRFTGESAVKAGAVRGLMTVLLNELNESMVGEVYSNKSQFEVTLRHKHSVTSGSRLNSYLHEIQVTLYA